MFYTYHCTDCTFIVMSVHRTYVFDQALTHCLEHPQHVGGFRVEQHKEAA